MLRATALAQSNQCIAKLAKASRRGEYENLNHSLLVVERGGTHGNRRVPITVKIDVHRLAEVRTHMLPHESCIVNPPNSTIVKASNLHFSSVVVK